MEDYHEALRQVLLLQHELQQFLFEKVDYLVEYYSSAVAKNESITSKEAIKRELRDMTFTASLSTNTALFKGKRPLAVIFPDCEVPVRKWKEVALYILRDCDMTYPGALDSLCGKLHGNHRTMLSASSDGMSAPLEIHEGLYFESKLDTEVLLKFLVEHVLIPLGYDYRSIRIRYTVK